MSFDFSTIDPFVIGISFLAVFLVALSKSGLVSSLSFVGVPLLSLTMPVREAVGILLPVLLAMDVIGLIAYRREVHWPNLKILLPGAIIGILLGWVFFAYISEGTVRLMIGVITVIFCLDEWLPLRKTLAGLHPSKPWGWFWGSLAGFTSFVSHTGGPPYQIYMLPQRLKPTLYAGTAVVFFSVVNSTKLIPYAFLGQLSVSNLVRSASLIPVAILGMLLGVYLVRRISTDLFYKMAYVLAFILALKLIYDGVLSFI
ncbi:sulfite exporter TauE/SafE family protein [Maritalea sp.]|uniref:sulfite exporter TauE/SafE family protein n=1 Tax=Maritalea sp. TaxID=2003361 RepID=UPI003EF2F96C